MKIHTYDEAILIFEISSKTRGLLLKFPLSSLETVQIDKWGPVLRNGTKTGLIIKAHQWHKQSDCNNHLSDSFFRWCLGSRFPNYLPKYIHITKILWTFIKNHFMKRKRYLEHVPIFKLQLYCQFTYFQKKHSKNIKHHYLVL